MKKAGAVDFVPKSLVMWILVAVAALIIYYLVSTVIDKLLNLY